MPTAIFPDDVPVAIGETLREAQRHGIHVVVVGYTAQDFDCYGAEIDGSPEIGVTVAAASVDADPLDGHVVGVGIYSLTAPLAAGSWATAKGVRIGTEVHDVIDVYGSLRAVTNEPESSVYTLYPEGQPPEGPLLSFTVNPTNEVSALRFQTPEQARLDEGCV